MEIKELKRRKAEFENELRDRLLAFCSETGVTVEDIGFEMWMEVGTPRCSAVILSIDVFGD